MLTGPCEYGILRDIRCPVQNILVHTSSKTVSKPKIPNTNKKTTCHDDRSTNRKKVSSARKKSEQTKTAKRARTLSESRSNNYRITPPATTSTRTLRSGLQQIDYLTLNDGYENDFETSPRKKKKITHRPRSAPSATRVAAQKHTISPEVKNTNKGLGTTSTSTLSVVPSTSEARNVTAVDLTGVPTVQIAETLPDLVQNSKPSNVNLPPVAAADPVSTEEELDAIDALLSLSEVRDNALEEDDNADLMPVGLPTNIMDAAPVPVRLDQLNVDTAIAELMQTEELEKQDNERPMPHPDQSATIPDETERDAK